MLIAFFLQIDFFPVRHPKIMISLVKVAKNLLVDIYREPQGGHFAPY